MSEVAVRGGEARFAVSLYNPADLALTDPDEYPVGPRFALYTTAVTPVVVPGFESIPYATRLGRGVFEVVVRIPRYHDEAKNLVAGSYTLRVVSATIASVALVDKDGNPPTQTLLLIDDPSTIGVDEQDRLYATPTELWEKFGIEEPDQALVRGCQAMCDDWMHRSLWPTVVKQERHRLPDDRNTIQLHITPVIKVYGAEPINPVTSSGLVGRYGYVRRDRRAMHQAHADYLTMSAVLGSPPTFTPIDPAQIDLRHNTGQIWLPTGFFLVPYTEVLVTYLTGLQVIPLTVKRALASVIDFVRFRGYANIMSYGVSKTSKSFKGEDLIPNDAKRALEPYRVKVML